MHVYKLVAEWVGAKEVGAEQVGVFESVRGAKAYAAMEFGRIDWETADPDTDTDRGKSARRRETFTIERVAVIADCDLGSFLQPDGTAIAAPDTPRS